MTATSRAADVGATEPDAPATAPDTRKREAKVLPRLLPWLTFALVLGLWQLLTSTGSMDKEFFSSPSGVWSAAVGSVQTKLFWNDVWVSFQEFLVGYGLSVVVAIPMGILAGLYRRVQYMVDPWLNALNAMPRIALIPLVVLWFGLGMESKIAVVFLGAAVSIAINTFDGTRSVSQDLLDVSRSYGASWTRRMISVVLPGVLPFALVGLRLGVGRAVAGVMVAEYFTSEAGLGNFIFRAGQTLQTGRLLFGAVVVTVLALAAFRGIASIERRFHRWRPSVGSAH